MINKQNREFIKKAKILLQNPPMAGFGLNRLIKPFPGKQLNCKKQKY